MLLILILMFPPYTGIRIAQSDNHRIFLGYHSLFFPPSRAYISSSFDNHKKSISSYNKKLIIKNNIMTEKIYTEENSEYLKNHPTWHIEDYFGKQNKLLKY